jgi:hypothetical protein
MGVQHCSVLYVAVQHGRVSENAFCPFVVHPYSSPRPADGVMNNCIAILLSEGDRQLSKNNGQRPPNQRFLVRR